MNIVWNWIRKRSEAEANEQKNHLIGTRNSVFDPIPMGSWHRLRVNNAFGFAWAYICLHQTKFISEWWNLCVLSKLNSTIEYKFRVRPTQPHKAVHATPSLPPPANTCPFRNRIYKYIYQLPAPQMSTNMSAQQWWRLQGKFTIFANLFQQ